MMETTHQQVNKICNECCDDIERMLYELGVDYHISQNRVVGCCPVHNGDNKTALNIYPEGEQVRGFWQCYTKGCENRFGKNLLGFVTGVLNSRYNQSKYDAIRWMLDFLGYESIEQVKPDTDEEVEIKNAIIKIDTMISSYFPIAFSNLANKLAVRFVKI